VQERFLELASSEVPPGEGRQFGTVGHPYVVEVSVSGPRAYVALSTGSGHMGAGGVYPVDYVLDTDGALEERWHAHFEAAGALWLVPHLHDLAAGGAVTEDALADEHLRRHGAVPRTHLLTVAPDVSAEEWRARRRAREESTAAMFDAARRRRAADGTTEPPEAPGTPA